MATTSMIEFVDLLMTKICDISLSSENRTLCRSGRKVLRSMYRENCAPSHQIQQSAEEMVASAYREGRIPIHRLRFRVSDGQ